MNQMWKKTTQKLKTLKHFELKNLNKKNMNNAWKRWFEWKKKGKRDLLKLEDKNLLKILGRKWKKKKNLDWIGRARRGKKLLKRFEMCEEHVREKSF